MRGRSARAHRGPRVWIARYFDAQQVPLHSLVEMNGKPFQIAGVTDS